MSELSFIIRVLFNPLVHLWFRVLIFTRLSLRRQPRDITPLQCNVRCTGSHSFFVHPIIHDRIRFSCIPSSRGIVSRLLLMVVWLRS